MTDPRQERAGGKLTTPPAPPDQASRKQAQPRRSATAGTDRDFDDSDRALNQGHGHPREERGQGE
jgi:hypothetical protein